MPSKRMLDRGGHTGIVKAGAGWIAGPYTDKVRNIGNTTIKWVEVDIYRPRNHNFSLDLCNELKADDIPGIHFKNKSEHRI